jgi:DNA-directed RNA polymerase subunit alpha
MSDLNIVSPDKIDVFPSKTPGSVQVVLAPFAKGLGLTVAVALRRIITSSIEGYAPYKVMIEGVEHEYDTIENVQEDVVDLLMNIKRLKIKCTQDQPQGFELVLDKKGVGIVTAKDLKKPGFVEIINEDLALAHITEKQHLSCRIFVKKDVGYKTAVQLKKEQAEEEGSEELGVIFLDSVFSPVQRVSYTIENARLGNRTDLDKLILQIHSNQTVDPIDIIRRAATILQYQLASFSDIKEKPSDQAEEGVQSCNPDFDLNISSLRFTVRAVNCLRGEGVDWVGQLVQRKESDLLKTPNLGRKSLAEIKSILSKHNLSLGMSTEGWVAPEGAPPLSDDASEDIG